MERGNSLYQEHYNLPLPSIENFAYAEQNHMIEQGQMHNNQSYNYDYARSQLYGYRNIPEHVFQIPGQHYQNYPQQMDIGQHPSLCNPMYQQPHSWGPYDVNSMIPNLNDLGGMNGSNRARHKRSRMSLQKRLLVNARERERMRVLNKAFEALRDALPCYIADGHMAKITTLRLAINYIKALTEVLEEQKDIDMEKEKRDSDLKDEEFDAEKLSLLEKLQNVEDESKIGNVSEEIVDEDEISKTESDVDEGF